MGADANGKDVLFEVRGGDTKGKELVVIFEACGAATTGVDANGQEVIVLFEACGCEATIVGVDIDGKNIVLEVVRELDGGCT